VGGARQEMEFHPDFKPDSVRLENNHMSLGRILLSVLCRSEVLGILLPNMGRKALSKCFLEEPEFNLGPKANMLIFRDS
jgi:hypothetical protein